MFLSSFLPYLKANISKKGAALGLTVATTSATTGGVASYYLFKEEDNKKILDNLTSELEKTREELLKKMRATKGEKFGGQMKLMQKEIALKAKISCFKREMENHDKNIGTWGTSSHQPKFNVCNNIKVDFN